MAKYTVPTHAHIKEHWDKLFDAINHQEDLIMVVVSASYVDYTLAALLNAHFVDSSKAEKVLAPGGCLGTLVSKAELAYLLGLITKEDRTNVEKIAEIRNKFAHRIDGISFGDEEVEKWCDDLENILLRSDIPLGSELAKLKDGGVKHANRSKMRFKLTAIILCTRITLNALSAKKCTELQPTTDTIVT